LGEPRTTKSINSPWVCGIEGFMSREVRTASTPLNGTAAVGADRRVRPLYHEKWIGIFARQVFIQGARQPGGPFQVFRRLFPGWPCPLSERKSDSTPGEAWPRGTRPWGIVFLTQYRFLGRLAPCPIAHFHALEKGRWLRPASSFVACRSPFVLRLSSFVVRLPPPFKPATFCPERTIMHHAYNLPIPS
jgi:hypothetical protein